MTLDERKLRLIRTHIPAEHLRILDIFSGNCEYSKWISEIYPTKLIVAIDKKANCKDIIMYKVEITCNTNTEALAEELGKNIYNVILLFDALEHTECYGKLLELCKYCITTDGVILGSTIGIPTDNVTNAIYQDSEHLHLFTKEFIVRLFKKYGFNNIIVSQDHEIIFFVAKQS